MTFLETVRHRWFRRPHTLHASAKVPGEGQPVVLLHGIGRSGKVWHPLIDELAHDGYSVVAFDLLGFGASPKPDWIDYTIDDHARAVIASIKRQRFGQKVVLVGHSLGSLVALRVARLRPDLVRHTVLYEMPLYDGLPEKRRYKARLAVYFKFYEWAIKQQPSFGEAKQQFGERVATKVVGLELTKATWLPFKRTLQNSIMKQTGADDIKHLKMPADVVYGSRDMLVIRGKVTAIFGQDLPHVSAHTVRARHEITKTAAKFLASRIRTAVAPEDI